jgi:hypothetical protein
VTKSLIIPTATLAEVYAAQGHGRVAANIYRQLLEKAPDNSDLQRKLSAIEKRLSDEDPHKDLRERVARRLSTWIQLLMRSAALQRVSHIAVGSKKKL